MLELARPAQRRARAARTERLHVGREADDGRRLRAAARSAGRGDNRFTFRWSQADDDADASSYDSGAAGARRRCHRHARRPQRGVRRAGSQLESTSSTPSPPCCSRPTCSCTRTDVEPATCRRSCPASACCPSFFNGPHRNVETYPVALGVRRLSLAADIGKSHVAMYSVNPAPRPDRAGRHRLRAQRRARVLLRARPSARRTCSRRGSSAGRGGRAHVVRVRVGGTIEQSLARLPRRQRHRRLSVARGQGRLRGSTSSPARR